MSSKIFVPPIKCQGIKTKLVPSIAEITAQVNFERWIEPFLGSGVVGFNIRPTQAIFSDSNPHIVNFYNALKNGLVTPGKAKVYLESEGAILRKSQGEHYYIVRERFNQKGEPLDFLFLNRACFNGMMRFNSKGGFNVPFCKKPNRFEQAYITKIVNQIKYIQEIIVTRDYSFVCQNFEQTLSLINAGDLIYCDPPYLGRHVDYYDSWSESNEIQLHYLLMNSQAKFILSTWHSNQYRKNDYIDKLWTGLNLITIEHFYHVGASEKNRNPMLEALITNFNSFINKKEVSQTRQISLF